MPLVSIVIPAYNEEGNLVLLHDRLRKVASQLVDCELEFMFVDDASTDRTPEILRSLGRIDPRVRTIRFARNFGSHIACMAGLTHAVGDAMIILSADLQDPPELIPSLIDQWRARHDIVWAVRQSRDDPQRNVLQARLFYWLFRKIAIPDFPAQGADFVLLSRRVADYIIKANEKNTSLFGLIGWLGFRSTQIPYDREARHKGVSKWTLSKTVKHAVDAFTAFSFFPIRCISYAGLGFIALGVLCFATGLAQRFIWDQAVSPWWWVLSAVFFIGGVQGVMIGIVGEYVWRALDQVRNRPLFILDEIKSDETDTEPDSEPLP